MDKQQRTFREMSARYLLFVAGLFLSALGIAFTKQGNLGLSTVSSVPYVLSLQFSQLSFGMWSTICNALLVAGQIAVLRRRFPPVQLLQIPFSVLFGYFIDIGVWITAPFPAPNYFMQAVAVLTGILILSLGITLAVIANVMYNAGEGLVKAISVVSGRKFGNVKIAVDIAIVSLACVLSLLFFGSIQGVREGTVAAALLTGMFVKLFQKPLAKPLERVINGKRSSDTPP